MSTTTEILATGATAASSNDVDVDSKPVTIIAVITSGNCGANVVLGTLMRKDSTGAYQAVTYTDENGLKRDVKFYADSKEATVCVPGNVRVLRPLLTGVDGTPSVRFDKAVSA